MKLLKLLFVIFSHFYYVQNFDLPFIRLPNLEHHFQKGPKLLSPRNSTSDNSLNNSTNTLTNSTSSNLAANSSNDTDDKQVCYGLLGCFDKKYYNEGNLPSIGWFAPDKPENLDITIMYFNNLDTKGQNLTFDSSKVNNFKKNLKTYILIHGWQSGFKYESWIDDLRDTLFQINNKSANVFVVDWSKKANSIFYPLSAANTKLVGRAVGYFITETLVKNYALDCRNVHILGHSLGAQTAGFVGKYTKTKNCFLKRITALDAAGPFFRSKDKEERVTENDAFFVEAIHTNAAPTVLTGLGTVLKSGVVDYWPNGGSTQEGCDLNDGIGNIIKDGLISAIDAPSCSHHRAPEIYAVNYDKVSSCQLIAYQCKDYSSFKNGKCGDCGSDNSKCRLVGLSSKYDPTKVPIPKKDEYFYLHTSENPPYCYHTYQVKFKIVENSTSRSIGNIYLDIIGRKRDAKAVKISSPPIGFASNNTYTLLLEKDLPLEELLRVEMYFSEGVLGVITSPKVFVEEVEINYLSNIDAQVRQSFSGIFKLKDKETKEISKTSKSKTVFIRKE